MPIVASHSLHALIRAVCAAGGSALEEATLVADQLVEANLTGHDSHGVGLLPVYVRCAARGLAGRQPPRRGRDRSRRGAGGRGPARLWPGDRPRGDAARDGARRRRGRGAARDPQQLPSRPHRPLGGAVRARRLRLDPLRQRHRPSAAAGALRRGRGAGQHQPVLRGAAGAGRAARAARHGDQQDRRRQGAGSPPIAACRCRRTACSTPRAGRPATAA